jgi:N-acetylneuraminic acid mutarotase
MKTRLLYLCILISINHLQPIQAQHIANGWSWFKGEKSINLPPQYGTIGLAEASNTPGGRNGAATCTIKGKFYLFGGSKTGNSGNEELNDLWEFDIKTNNWRLLKGSILTDIQGVYGTKGTPELANNPGSRTCAAIWVYRDDIYIMGGLGFGTSNEIGYLNDTWKYDIAMNTWVWLSGSNQVNQAGKYFPFSPKMPGGRNLTTNWTLNNEFYLFGGYGYASDPNDNGSLNDIWKFNPVTLVWTKLKGSNNINEVGIYGTIRVPNMNNNPGARSKAMGQLVNNKFYLIGGYGFGNTTNGYLNDVWVYDYIQNEWNWLNGSNTVNSLGSYGILEEENDTNIISGRASCLEWTYNNNIYFYGGFGNNNLGTIGTFSDLWIYKPSNNSFTLQKGDNIMDKVGHFGTKGIPAASDYPNCLSNASGWYYDKKLYLFGGNGKILTQNQLLISGFFNNIWVFTPKCINNDMYSLNSGNWTDSDIWSCGRVPTNQDHFLKIKNNHILNINVNVATYNLNIENEGKLVIAPNKTLTLLQIPE